MADDNQFNPPPLDPSLSQSPSEEPTFSESDQPTVIETPAPETPTPESSVEPLPSPITPPPSPITPSPTSSSGVQIQAAHNSSSNPNKSKLALLGIVLLLLVAIPSAVYLVLQRQEVRKNADEEKNQTGLGANEGQLICMPIDDQGNITNNKYRYNRIKVINNTNQDARLWNQRNFCDYENNPRDPYRCDHYGNYDLDVIPKGKEEIFSVQPECNQTGQLDLRRCETSAGEISECQNNGLPECYNTADSQEWEGGIAFTIYSRPACELTPSPTPSVTPPVSPSPSITPPLSPTPSPTLSPAPGLNCTSLRVYTTDWQEIKSTDWASLTLPQTVNFVATGTCDEAQGITKARFRVNNGAWVTVENPQQKHQGNFYYPYQINQPGTYKVEVMVYNPALGWR